MVSKGFVLFTTILMLAMVTLLILSLMQAVLLYVKAGNQITKRHQAFYQLETVTHLLWHSHLEHHDSQCTVEDKSPNEVLGLLQHHHGCEKVFGQQAYLYLIEDLGSFPCLRIELHHQIWSSHHWRLTVMAKMPPYATLQLQFSKPVSLQACDGHAVIIREGVVSWRHLTTT